MRTLPRLYITNLCHIFFECYNAHAVAFVSGLVPELPLFSLKAATMQVHMEEEEEEKKRLSGIGIHMLQVHVNTLVYTIK